MKRSYLKPSIKPMRRTALSRGLTGLLSSASVQLAAREQDAIKTRKPRKRLKSKQRAVTVEEKPIWDRMCTEVGCIACALDGRFNAYVSIHHIDGRTKPGCHKKVLPLCAGHHQDGAGEDKTLIAVHPYKAQFERRYGTQCELLALVMQKLGVGQ